MGPASSELASWRIAAYLLIALSSTIFIIQRFIFSFLDPIFELCIFHIPALVASLTYLIMGLRAGESRMDK
jgi:O-antigen ligase